MTKQHVTMSFFTFDHNALVPTGAWYVKPKTWLERLCWWLLRKERSEYCREEPVVRQVTIDTNRAALAIIQEAKYHFYDLYDKKPVQVLIGPEDFARIMADDSLSRFNFHHGEYAFETSLQKVEARTGSVSIVGLQVRVIPHMVGMLVL